MAKPRRTGLSLGLFLAAGGLLIPPAWTGLAVETAEPPPHAQGPEAPATQEVSSASLPAGKPQRAVVIPIRDEITEVTYKSVDRRLTAARQEGFDVVVIELDTPGGLLKATLDICQELKRLRDDGVRVVAWVNRSAYSAGTIVALAAGSVVMAANATMGDCQPIMMSPQGVSAVPEDVDAKITSPLMAELRDSARRNGYNMDLIESLIRPELQVFWLVNTETGERRFVNRRARDELFGLETGAGRSGSGVLRLLGAEGEKAALVEPVPDSRSRTAWRYVTEDPLIGTVKQPVVSERELLTMRDREARAFGFSAATVSSDRELQDFLGVQTPLRRLESSWPEAVVEWLASPMVRGVLFLLMVLGAYTEFQTPGFGLPGGVALVALILFFGAPYLAGFTVTWELVAVAVGLLLIAVEIFLLPGFGVPGILGLLLVGFGVLWSFVPPEPGPPSFVPRLPTMQMTYDYFYGGLKATAGGLTGAVAGILLLARYLSRLPVARHIIAPNPTREQIAVDDPYAGVARVGDLGRAESLLRPAGKARFGDRLLDVVSEDGYVPAGTPVRITRREGVKVVVRRVEDSGSPSA